jgi:hypothetical protein
MPPLTLTSACLHTPLRLHRQKPWLQNGDLLHHLQCWPRGSQVPVRHFRPIHTQLTSASQTRVDHIQPSLGAWGQHSCVPGDAAEGDGWVQTAMASRVAVHKLNTSVAISLHMPPTPPAANNTTHLHAAALVVQAHYADQKQQPAPAPEADQGPVGDAGSSDDSDDGFVAITKPLSGSTTPSDGTSCRRAVPFCQCWRSSRWV